MQAQELMSALSTRLRDPTRLAHLDADLLRAITLAQQVVNATEEVVFGTYEFATAPSVSIYPIHANIPQVVKIASVRQDDRDLDNVSLMQLREADINWLRRKGTRFEEYCSIGRGLLAFYPLVDHTTTLHIRYVKHTNVLASASDPIELGDEYVPAILDFAELLLNLRQRKLAQVQSIVESLAGFLGSGDGGKG